MKQGSHAGHLRHPGNDWIQGNVSVVPINVHHTSLLGPKSAENVHRYPNM